MLNTPPQPPHVTLGIPAWADHHTIKRAYRKLALRYHPDHDPSPGAAQRFRAVHAAYRTLMATTQRHGSTGPQSEQRKPGNGQKAWSPRVVRGPTPQERFVYRALHATGLCFGLAVIASVVASIAILDMSQFNLVLALPGIVILPDSIEGLRS